MAEKKKKRRKTKIISKRKGTWISRPFGKFADPFSSDSSDSDYIPDEAVDPSVKLPGKRKRTKSGKGSSTMEEDPLGTCKKKLKLEKTGNLLKQTLDSREWDRISLSSSADWNNIPTEIIVKIFNLLIQDSNGIQLILRYIFF